MCKSGALRQEYDQMPEIHQAGRVKYYRKEIKRVRSKIMRDQDSFLGHYEDFVFY